MKVEIEVRNSHRDGADPNSGSVPNRHPLFHRVTLLIHAECPTTCPEQTPSATRCALNGPARFRQMWDADNPPKHDLKACPSQSVSGVNTHIERAQQSTLGSHRISYNGYMRAYVIANPVPTPEEMGEMLSPKRVAALRRIMSTPAQRETSKAASGLRSHSRRKSSRRSSARSTAGK
jgi:hypothetical protein